MTLCMNIYLYALDQHIHVHVVCVVVIVCGCAPPRSSQEVAAEDTPSLPEDAVLVSWSTSLVLLLWTQ